MIAAELYVKLGVKGADDARKQLKNVSESTSGISTSAFAAYEAISKMISKMAEMVTSAGSAGNSLVQFSILTGESLETLQKYEYAMIKSGGSAESFRNSISSLLDKMTHMNLLSGEAATGFATFNSVVPIKDSDKKNMGTYVDWLQRVQKEIKNPNLFRIHGKSLGLDDAFISSLIQDSYTKKKLASAPFITNKEAYGVKSAYVELAKIKAQSDIALQKVIAEFAPALIPQIADLTKNIVEMIKAFAQLSKDLSLIERMSEFFKSIATSMTQIKFLITGTKGLSNMVGSFFGDEASQSKSKDSADKNFSSAKKMLEEIRKRNENKGEYSKFNQDEMYKNFQGGGAALKSLFIPESPKDFRGPPSNLQNIHVNQKLEFNHDGKDHKKTSDSVKKAIEGAFTQMPSRTQVD